jgi:hypothetical protein
LIGEGEKISEWSQPDKLKNKYYYGSKEKSKEDRKEESSAEEEARIVFLV